MREGITFYKSWRDALLNLSPEDCKKALTMILNYGLDGIEPETEGIAYSIFLMAKPTLDRNERLATNARKSKSKQEPEENKPKAKRSKSKQIEADESRLKQNEADESRLKQTVSTETETDTETNIKTLSDDNVRCTPSASNGTSAVIAAWNTLPEPVPRVSRLSSETDRYKMLKARIAQYGVDEVLKAIRNIKDSDFLTGKAGTFLISFDWFIRPNNFVKVLDGNYQNKPKANMPRADDKKKQIQFNQFHQRDYDYDDLQKQLIAKQMQ